MDGPGLGLAQYQRPLYEYLGGGERLSIVSMSRSRSGQERKGLEVSPNDERGRRGRDDRVMASLNEQGMVQDG